MWWTNPPPPVWTNAPPDWTNQPPAWTNHAPVFTNPPPPVWTNIWAGLTNIFDQFTNRWWTNGMFFTNPPPRLSWTNFHNQRTLPPGATNGPGLSKSVQALIQQFQQQRSQLMSALGAASDTQRQQLLGQLETVRQQLEEQLAAYRAQLRNQLSDMQSQYGRHFIPGSTSGADPSGPGHGRPRD
jgi:hypothetical protein